MPSSYTTSLRLTLPATGELAGQWGNTVNTGITELLDAAVAGTTTISTWGGAGVSYTLSNNSGSADEARRMFIVATGTPGEAKNVICPAVSKFYVFRNDTTGGFALTLKTPSGTGVSVPAGQYRFLYCDGTNVVEMFNSVGSLTVIGALNAGSVNATTLDLTNLEVTNIKAKDGTASMTLADATGVATFSANPILNAGTANGVLYLNGSKVATSGSALAFDGLNALSLGSGGTANTATSLTLNATDNAANGSYIVGKRNGTNAWLIGDTASGLGSGTGFLSYNYGTSPWIWFLQSGGEQMRLTSTGLGIGTSSPGYRLDVVGVGKASSALAIGDSSGNLSGTFTNESDVSKSVTFNADPANVGASSFMRWNVDGTERMRLDSSGNLGIGTSSPNFKLVVNNNASAPTANGFSANEVALQIAGKDGNNTRILYQSYGGVNNFLNAFAYGGTFASPGATISGTNIFGISAGGYGTTTALSGLARISINAESTFTDTSAPTYINFQTTPTGSIAATDRMRLDSSGNLGIGTSSPGARLHVVGSQTILQGVSGAYSIWKDGTPTKAGRMVFNTAVPDGLEWGLFDGSSWSSGMVLTPAGNIGIGTSSPSARLHVVGNQFRQNDATNSQGYVINTTSPTTTLATLFGGSSFAVQTGGSGTNQLLLDASGNLGLGVTPSAWAGGGKAIQVNARASLFGFSDDVNTGLNTYYDGSVFRYIQTGFASLAVQTAGQHRWFNAPSGTAGNAISFTQAMTLTADGRLGIGVTNPAYTFVTAFDAAVTAGSCTTLLSAEGGAQGSVGTTTNHALLLKTNNTERARITSEGNLGVGTTSPTNYGAAYKTIAVNGTSGGMFEFQVAGSSAGYMTADASSLSILAGGSRVLSLYTNGTERARITSDGKLLLGTTATYSGNAARQNIYYAGVGTEYGITLNAGSVTTNATALSFLVNGDASGGGGTAVGSVTCSSSATNYNTSSDYRLKDNPQPLTGSGAFIDALQPKTWNWKTDGSRGVGFIAHEAQAVSPSSVTGTKDAVGEDGKPVMQAMEYGSAEFIANIIAELQSLRARVAALESQP